MVLGGSAASCLRIIPACAGMILAGFLDGCDEARKPRVCGDDPEQAMAWVTPNP